MMPETGAAQPLAAASRNTDVLVADVVVDVDAPNAKPWYSYTVPDDLRPAIRQGTRVRVGFGGHDVAGIVISTRAAGETTPDRLKPIVCVIEADASVDAEHIELARWISERYVSPLSVGMRCVAPPILTSRVTRRVSLRDDLLDSAGADKSTSEARVLDALRSAGGQLDVAALRRAVGTTDFAAGRRALLKKGLLVERTEIAPPRASPKRVLVYALAAPALAEAVRARNLGARQLLIVQELERRADAGAGPATAAELREATGAGPSSLTALVARGAVSVSSAPVRRSPVRSRPRLTEALELTRDQRRAVAAISDSVATGRSRAFLLFGVTASGKTEVYLRSIAAARQFGRSAVVLVPEIALTSQVVETFAARFRNELAVLHSRLSDGERHDEWRRIQSGEATVVIGARSAVFAPLKRPGLIVVDEEHEPSYKQETRPRYNAREAAMYRGNLCGATVVLGSATPALETYFATEAAAGQPAAITRIELPGRIDGRAMPDVHVVDMRAEYRQRPALFAGRLVEALADRLRNRQQVILFLNRRGYGRFILCRDCGYVARCPNCAVSLTYHAERRALRCHHCDYMSVAPSHCPTCSGPRIRVYGIGTERVEEEVVSRFPSARVLRMDRDTTSRKGAHERIVTEFRKGSADILIGTQMVAKGLHFPGVTLVGVINADDALNMPDFRAAERTYQLLTQVAGRAGRGGDAGEVIVQTFEPDHYAVVAAALQDYRQFYRQEIVFRQELRYPPFSRLANLVCSSATAAHASKQAASLAAALRSVAGDGLDVIGPASAPLARLKGQFRFHVALRGAPDTPLDGLVREALQRLSAEDRASVVVDIDPLNLA